MPPAWGWRRWGLVHWFPVAISHGSFAESEKPRDSPLAVLLAVHIWAFLPNLAIGKPQNPIAMLLTVHIGAFSITAIGTPKNPMAVLFAVHK